MQCKEDNLSRIIFSTLKPHNIDSTINKHVPIRQIIVYSLNINPLFTYTKHISPLFSLYAVYNMIQYYKITISIICFVEYCQI